MPVRMERPDQDEEERKEELEFVKTGDTRTGLCSALHPRSVVLSFMKRTLHPVHHDVDLEKADQRRSETRRTTFSDQDKEEWKEEAEFGRAGDTWTGPRSASRRPLHLRSKVHYFLSSVEGGLHTVHHITLQKADQCRSETRSTTFSDQDEEEWKEEAESGRAGDTRTGPRSAPRKPLALRPLIALLMGENLSPAADDIDNDTADQHRTESSAWGDSPFSPKTLASWMGREWPTAHRKDDCDFPDQPTTSKSDTQRRKLAPEYACNVFRTWSAAAVWIMMALTVATSSLAGAECIGTEVKLDKGEAVLRCPLPVDVSDTHRGIIVKHFPTPDSAAEVLFCYWSEETGKPECESSDSFSLEGQLTDQVVAKVPVSRLMDSGAYKCQLYPPDYQRPFTPCHIHHFSDNDEGSAVAPTPVAPSITTKRSTPGQDPLDREAPPCVGQSGSVALTAAVLILQVIIFILLVVNFLYLQTKKNLQKPVMSKRATTSSNQTSITTEYHSVSSESETATSSNQTSITMDYHSAPSEEL